MARRKTPRDTGSKPAKKKVATKLRVGDTVMVLKGGNRKKGKTLKGQTGKILRVFPRKGRVIVEGVNVIKRHKRAQASNEASGIIEKEGSIAISTVMYYSEDLKRPVRLRVKSRDDGRSVRGYLHPESGEFEQIDT